MRAAPLLLGLAAAASLTAEAEGCSGMYHRPSALVGDETITSRPAMREIVREAAHIDIAIVTEQSAIGTLTFPGFPDYEIDRLSATFEIVEHVRGGGPNRFVAEAAGGHAIVATSYAGSTLPYEMGFEDVEYLEHRQILNTEPITSCGGIAGVSFETGSAYVVTRDPYGEISSAIPLVPAPVEALDYPFEAMEEHLWLRAMRYMVANPQSEYVWESTARNWLLGRDGYILYEVEDCSRPALSELRRRGELWFGYPDEIDGYPATFDEFMESDLATSARVLPGEPPIGIADYEVIDQARYARFPFNAETCNVGDRYLRLDFLRYLQVSEDGTVDLTLIESQVRITDAGIYPLHQIESWFEAAHD